MNFQNRLQKACMAYASQGPMPKFSVDCSILVSGSPEQAYPIVRDFKEWRGWSPWLIMEEAAEMSVAPDGDSYTWAGKLVGEGGMTLQKEKPFSSIHFGLEFIKPWKSRADIAFYFEEEGDQTRVRWTMESQLPWFLFWMKGMMTTFISMDYNRGLGMLKDRIELGAVPSVLEIVGEKSFSGTPFVGRKTTCKMADIAAAMAEEMKAIDAWVTSSGIPTAEQAFSIYHALDMKRGETTFTTGIPAPDGDVPLVEGMVSGEIPALSTFQIRHTGPYRHLGNAWSAGMLRDRNKVFKKDKSFPPFEIYTNDPVNTPEERVETVVHFPLK